MAEQPSNNNQHQSVSYASIRATAEEIAGSEAEPRPLVLGEGNPDALLMIVGEGPGFEEERRQRPFVGPAGRLLDRWLANVNIRRQDIWLTNVVKTRKVTTTGGRLKNRTPRVSEIRAWWPVLEAELEWIHPAIILCLGAPAAKAVIGADFRLTEQRGQWYSGPLDSQVLATFHPAYVLRLEGEDRERVEGLVELDFANVAGTLADVQRSRGQAQERAEHLLESQSQIDDHLEAD